MRHELLRVYHRLPPALKSVAATMRGAYLRAWRFGPGFEALVESALERDRWTTDQWRAWRETRLADVLHRAATRVPFYRDYWNRRRARGDAASWELLDNWPVLEKESVRQHPHAFVADDRNPARMFHEHTSGTTGKSLDLWFSRAALREWYALHEARARRWYGVSRANRWAIVGGQLVVDVTRQRPPFWVWNAAMRQLYLSAYHLAPRSARVYADALRSHGVRYILGYPSALHTIAQELIAQGIRGPELIVAISNAEPLFDFQREAIHDAFGCAVRDTYGMSEAVCAASECERGSAHLWPEVGMLEVCDDDGRRVEATNAGEFICTGLLNSDMPLIRYRVGDRGALAPESRQCACGRLLPQLEFVEGRTDDVLHTRDGRTVGRMDPVFKSRLPIREAQIIQDTLDVIRVRYVPAEGFTRADGESITERIRARLGPVAVVLEEVDAIPRTSNGKFRAVVCKLDIKQRGQFTGGDSVGGARGSGNT